MNETRTADPLRHKDCRALRILEAQPDFANEISLLVGTAKFVRLDIK
jgi:hypothetical protein